jgi:hypothetical protein
MVNESSHRWDTDRQAKGVILCKAIVDQHSEEELKKRLKIASGESSGKEPDASELLETFDEHAHPGFLDRF